MVLDVGNVQQVENPSAEQVAYHLRHLPENAPFLILNGDEHLFVQVTPHGAAYRVEWRQGDTFRFTIVPIDRAGELLQAFHSWDEAALAAAAWRPLRWFNDPALRPFMLMATLFVLPLIGLFIWAWG